MIGKILAITKKNLILLARSKISTTILFTGPLLLIVFLGLGITSNFSHVRVTYLLEGIDEQEGEEFLSKLRTVEGFTLVPSGTADTCIQRVGRGEYHMCIVYRGIGRETSIHVDIAKSNLAYAILSIVSEKLEGSAAGVSTQMIESLFSHFINASSQLETESKGLIKMSSQVARLPLQIASIRDGIGEFSLDLNFSLGSDKGFRQTTQLISQYEEEEEAYYSLNKERLEELRVVVVDKKEDLKVKRDERDENLRIVREAQDSNNCASKNVVDLRPIIQNNEDFDFLANNAECSVLYTVEQQILDETKDLDESIEILEEVQGQLDDFSGELETYHTRVDKDLRDSLKTMRDFEKLFAIASRQLQDAQLRVGAMKTQRDALLDDLSGISSSIEDSIFWIESLQFTLNQLADDFSKIQAGNASLIINPIATNYLLQHQSQNQLDQFFPSLLALILTFSCMLLSSFIIVREKMSTSFFRNAILPVSNSTLLMGVLLSVTLVGFIQSSIVFFLAKYAFSISGLEHTAGILLIIVIGCVIFSLIGMVIGALLRTQESALLTGIFISIILFVFSGAFIPLELMSEVVFFLAKFNPFMLLEIMFKRSIIYRLDVFSLDLMVIYLVECVALAVYALFFFSRAKKQL